MTDQLHFYWRPGCLFSMSLERQLKRAGLEFEPHNIWDEEDAALFVRSVARGAETVPTVAVGDVALVNPTAEQVFVALEEQAPHLLPDGFEIPERRGVGRWLGRLLGHGS